MNQWNSANSSGHALDLALLDPIPLGLNPRWLTSHLAGANQSLQYFLLGDPGRPRGYAPFIVHQGALAYCFGETTVFHVPVLRYATQGAPLCESREQLTGLFAPLREAVGKRGVAFFEAVPAGSALFDLLTSPTSPIYALFHVVPYGPTYARRLIELPDGSQFEDYLLALRGKTRSGLRRLRRDFTADAKDEVRVTRYTEAEQAEELAAVLAQVSRKTYQHHLLGLGLEDTPQHVEQLRAAAIAGWLRAYILWIGEKPVAFQLGYRDAHTYHLHHVGHDPEMAKLQPGIYLHTEVMADLLAHGICRFDFLSGDGIYKQKLSTSFREERHYYLIPRGWPGTVYARALVMINFLSEKIGRGLEKSGLKERIRRLVRASAVSRSRD